ncbi:MAG TPA: right-handed parallel beta-helix repeat-containing protein [Bacteroidales bacterium]|nr:right-handed parallel beta-helix repeat-containing protein [Bacteroidales bacterium]
MKREKFVVLFCVTVLFLSINLISQNVVKVDNTLDFLNAIKSNTTIELAPGTYNLTSVIEEINNVNVGTYNNYDGYEPVLTEVHNLTIKGKGDVKILIEPRYAWVMTFISCNNLRIEGITFGHTEKGYCAGGVLSFTECSNIVIKSCSLYGCGTVGINANLCSDVSVINSEIHDCSYGLLYLYDSNDISFKKTMFRNTGEFNLIEIMNCYNISFEKCTFKDNYTNEFMPHLFSIDENIWFGYTEDETKLSSDIWVKKCEFKNNKIQSFVNNDSNFIVVGCKFSNNGFDF